MTPSSQGSPFLLQASGLTFGWGRKTVLEYFSLNLAAGEIVGLIGPNGCGKSTLLKVLAGIVSSPSEITLGSDRLFDLSAAGRASRIVYLGSEIRAEFPIRAIEAVMMGVFSRSALDADSGRAAAMAALARCHCAELAGRALHALSGGERQLVALARALVQGSKIILLDEALSRMDLHHQAAIGKLLIELAKDGYAIVLVSHDLNMTSEWATRCILMKNGRKLADGLPRDILTAEAMKSLYPGAELVVGANPKSGAVKIFFGQILTRF